MPVSPCACVCTREVGLRRRDRHTHSRRRNSPGSRTRWWTWAGAAENVRAAPPRTSRRPSSEGFEIRQVARSGVSRSPFSNRTNVARHRERRALERLVEPRRDRDNRDRAWAAPCPSSRASGTRISTCSCSPVGLDEHADDAARRAGRAPAPARSRKPRREQDQQAEREQGTGPRAGGAKLQGALSDLGMPVARDSEAMPAAAPLRRPASRRRAGAERRQRGIRTCRFGCRLPQSGSPRRPGARTSARAYRCPPRPCRGCRASRWRRCAPSGTGRVAARAAEGREHLEGLRGAACRRTGWCRRRCRGSSAPGPRRCRDPRPSRCPSVSGRMNFSSMNGAVGLEHLHPVVDRSQT